MIKLLLEQLESKETPLSLTLNFDFDHLGLFDGKHEIMQNFADRYADQLEYSLDSIDEPFFAVTQLGSIDIPKVKADEMIIYIGNDLNKNNIASAAPGTYYQEGNNQLRNWGGAIGFNPSINWSFDGTPLPNEYDINTIFKHEVNHVFGLNHSDNAGSLMYFAISPGVTKNITVDDKNALEKVGISLKSPISPEWGKINSPFPGFNGTFQVQIADFNGDKVSDVVFSAGPGGGPHVKIVDGATGQHMASFFAFQSDFTGGVNIAVGDYTQDGKPDLIVGAGVGGGPRLQIYDNAQNKTFDQFVFDSEKPTGVGVNWFNNTIVANDGNQFKVIQ